MIINCDECVMQGLSCANCVVSAFLATPAAEADCGDVGRCSVELDPCEQAAVAALVGAGLLPPLRLVPALTAAQLAGFEPPHGTRPRRAG